MDAEEGGGADKDAIPVVVASPFVPPSLVRRIVLDDPEVGRLTREVPAMIATALHLFMSDLVEQAGSQALAAAPGEHHHSNGQGSPGASHSDVSRSAQCSYCEAVVGRGSVGMTLVEHEDTLRVDEVSRGGQAHKRGVVAGDVLVRVGDTPCEATSLEAAVAIIEAAPRPVTQ